MRVLAAKVVNSRQEDPASEPDRRTDTWIIEAKLKEHVLGWEEGRIDLQAAAPCKGVAPLPVVLSSMPDFRSSSKTPDLMCGPTVAATTARLRSMYKKTRFHIGEVPISPRKGAFPRWYEEKPERQWGL
jgi:hypothetical protein